MRKKLLVAAGALAALLTLNLAANGHTLRYHGNPDLYVYIPPDYAMSCADARSHLQHQGYRILRTIRCGGNYHKFRAQRRGFDYLVQVMTCRGKRMIDARSS